MINKLYLIDLHFATTVEKNYLCVQYFEFSILFATICEIHYSLKHQKKFIATMSFLPSKVVKKTKTNTYTRQIAITFAKTEHVCRMYISVVRIVSEILELLDFKMFYLSSDKVDALLSNAC